MANISKVFCLNTSGVAQNFPAKNRRLRRVSARAGVAAPAHECAGGYTHTSRKIRDTSQEARASRGKNNKQDGAKSGDFGERIFYISIISGISS
jgi:hypothetical protein